jgi:hypothetical protein
MYRTSVYTRSSTMQRTSTLAVSGTAVLTTKPLRFSSAYREAKFRRGRELTYLRTAVAAATYLNLAIQYTTAV